MQTVEAFAADFILHREDGGRADPGALPPDPRDDGNWTGGKRGCGALVGSPHGVTPAVLAEHRGVPVASITRATMRTLTITEAVAIALGRFYHRAGLDRLAWNRVTASIFDFDYTAGEHMGVILVQRALGLKDDGVVGPTTSAAYAAWLARLGETGAARAWAQLREGHYREIVHDHPAKGVNLRGWLNRTADYLPGTAWWTRMEATR